MGISLWILGRFWTHSPPAILPLRAVNAGVQPQMQFCINVLRRYLVCFKGPCNGLWSPKCYISPTESFESSSTRFPNVLIDSITNNSNDVSAFLISQARLNKTGLIGACMFINRWSHRFSHMKKLSYPIQLPHKYVTVHETTRHRYQ